MRCGREALTGVAEAVLNGRFQPLPGGVGTLRQVMRLDAAVQPQAQSDRGAVRRQEVPKVA
jgi:hypothetical protein